MEPSVSTFIGLLQLSEVGLAVKKEQKQGEKLIELFWLENAYSQVPNRTHGSKKINTAQKEHQSPC